MKKVLWLLGFVVSMVLSVSGCKQSLTREAYLKGEPGGPWGYLYGTRELVREGVGFQLLMSLRIEPLEENGEKPFSIGATSAQKGYYFYRVKPGKYTIKEWSVSGGESKTKTYPVNYVFEVQENIITYLGHTIFFQKGFVGERYDWVSYMMTSIDTMKEDMEMLYKDIPETKELKVLNKAWKFTSEK